MINKRNIIILTYIFLCIIGIFLSFQVTLQTHGIEPDTVHSIILWNNINKYGITWLNDWIFTQDSWLFSLFPIHFLLFFIFGGKPIIPILVGWIIYILSIFISGLIALELESKKSFYIITLVLLFFGSYAYTSGYITYSTSHNITNLFGLLSVYLYIRFIKSNKIIYVIGIFFLQFLGGLSDPWMIASFTLPFIIVTLILIFIYKSERVKNNMIFVTLMILSIIFIKISFTLLIFLPDQPFLIGTREVLNSNFIFLIKDLGGLLNIFPGVDNNIFFTSLLSLFFIFILFALSIYILIKKNLNKHNTAFIIFSFFSVGGIILAFILTHVPAADYSARFLINIIYLFIILIIIAIVKNWNSTRRAFKIYSCSIALLFIISSFYSNIKYIKNPTNSLETKWIDTFINFLSKEGLNYGYGPYGSSLANAVTVASSEKVIIRPIYFTNENLMFLGRPQTSNKWYEKSDYPKEQENFFIILDKMGEICNNLEVCTKNLEYLYGKPTRILTFDQLFIFVWNHPLIDYYELKNLDNNEIVNFNSNKIGFKNWSSVEEEFRWSLGNESKIVFSCLKESLNIKGTLSLNIRTLGEQEIRVSLNDILIGTKLINGTDEYIQFTFDKNILRDGENIIKFNFPNAQKAGNGDNRVLAMALKNFSIK